MKNNFIQPQQAINQQYSANAERRSSRLAAWFAPKQASAWAWLEVGLLTFGVLALAAWALPADPLWIKQPFPWLWLMPAVLALRYGCVAALSASAIFFIDWSLMQRSSTQVATFPGQYFLGGLILTLVAGQFSDIWSARLKRVREINNYLSQRLESLTRNHYLLRTSHERLEQDLLIKPVTLRDSLLHLRHLTAVSRGQPSTLPAVQELMRILTQACQLEVASLHRKINGGFEGRPSASLGDIQALEVHDPLVKYALAQQKLCHVQTNALEGVSSRYLVVAPLLSASNQCVGLLVIERMPFMSLHAESLQFINVTLGYYADAISMAPAVSTILAKLPECPLLFAAELMRLERVRSQCDVDSVIVALIFANSVHQQDLLDEVERQHRQLDIIWSIQKPEQCILLVLMPLSGSSAINSYLGRIEARLCEQFGATSLSALNIKHRTAYVGEQPAEELVAGLLERCYAN
jgi:hypothetical protein